MLSKKWHIFGMIPKGRGRDKKHSQTIVEVFPEPSTLNHGKQVRLVAAMIRH